MKAVGVHEAKTRLSALLREVETGREVMITRGGKPVAKVIPAEPARPSVRRFGLLAAEVADPGDWDEDESDALGDLFGIGDANAQ